MDDLSRRSGGRKAKSVVFTAEQIAARVASLGREITSAYPDGDLVLLGLLKGSFIFLADLVRAVERPLQVDFLVASSYGSGTVSSAWMMRSAMKTINWALSS